MDGTTLLPSLSLLTIVGALVVLVAAFAYFLRHRRNRAAASRALGLDDRSR